MHHLSPLQYAIRATFLGFTFSSSILLAVLSPLKWKAFGVYGTIMSIFHYSEFLAIAWSNPSSLSTSSFILNHSLHYALAAIASWIEFLVEVNFWPEVKEYWTITIIGALLCLGGELLRKLAIVTANTNFNHIVSINTLEVVVVVPFVRKELLKFHRRIFSSQKS